MVGKIFSWHALFYLRITVPFIIGIILSDKLLLPVLIGWALILVPLLIIIVLGFAKIHVQYKFDTLSGVLLSLAFIGVGCIRYDAYQPLNRTDHFSKHQGEWIIGEVKTPPLERKNFRTYQINCVAIASNGTLAKASGEIVLQVKKEESKHVLAYGDIISIPAKKIQLIQAPSPLDAFDYQKMMSLKGIYHQVFCKSIEIKKVGKTNKNTLSFFAFQTMTYVKEKLNATLSNNEIRGFALALLLGNKSQLDKEIYSQFATTGTMHVLAVSGLHTGILYIILNFILLPLNKKKYGNRIKTVLIIICLYGYAVITGLSPSVVRAATMFSIVQIAGIFERKPVIYNSIFASAFYILLISPNALFHIGFQLSYIAVMGIISLQKTLSSLYLPPNKTSKYFWELSTVSFAAQLATFPISIYYFHQFPSYFLVANLVVIPFIFILLIGLLLLILTHSIPWIGDGITWMVDTLISWLLNITETMSRLPKATIKGLYISEVVLILLYLVILLCIAGISNKNRRLLHLSGYVSIILLGVLIVEAYKNETRSKILQFDYKNTPIIVLYEGRKQTIILPEKERENHIMWTQKVKPLQAKEKTSELIFGVKKQRNKSKKKK